MPSNSNWQHCLKSLVPLHQIQVILPKIYILDQKDLDEATLRQSMTFNTNWHEGCPFWIRICQLNFYQKFPNFYGGENWHFDTLPSSLSHIKNAPKPGLYILDAVTSSGILKAKQKLGVTFNDKQDVIDFKKFSKMTMCRASEVNS